MVGMMPDAAPTRVRASDLARIDLAVFGHARRQPEAVAVREPGGEQVSYGRLAATAQDYAQELSARGVGPGAIVPVLLPRTTQMIACLLAILRCGAAYAALDPRWPAQRLARLVGTLPTPVVVGSETVGDTALPVWQPGPLSSHSTPGTDPITAPNEAAALFFTSGTTGTPRGVLSPHRATLRLFDPCVFADLGPDAVVLQAAPQPWDGFTLEAWGALVTGSTLVPIGDEQLTPARLRGLISQAGLNTMWLTASLFNLFVDEDVSCFAGLKQLMTGGERLSPAHVSRFLTAHPEITLVNGYGPVESCVFATTHRVCLADCADPEGIPIGRPVPRTSVHILDGTTVCGPGAEGEICVAGDGLAMGYLGDPEATAAKFVTVTVEGIPTRLYRTGDLGAFGADGLLRFRGRADRQVKIRGHRVEPEEVERIVTAVDGVGWSSAVAAPAASGGSHRLVLFYTARHTADGGPGPDPAALRAGLAAVLPPHLMPDVFHRVDRPPVTANGKVDRAALLGLLPEGDAGTGGATGIGDGTAGEPGDLVARVFADIVGVEAVDTEASFYESGGTSLDLVRLGIRLSRTGGFEVTPDDIVRHPSPKALAGWLARRRAEQSGTAPESWPAPVAGAAATIEGPIRLSGMQAGFCMTQLLRPKDVSALCLMQWTVDGDVDADVLEAALGDVQDWHPALRAEFSVAGVPMARVRAAGTSVDFKVLPDRIGTAEAEQALQGHLTRPLDIGAGQIWRSAMVRCGDTGSQFFGIAIHHVSFDGHSESILAADLSAAYQARLEGRTPQSGRGVGELWPSAAVETVTEDRRSAALEYWYGHLRSPSVLAWPITEPAMDDEPGRCATLEFVLPQVAGRRWLRTAADRATRPYAVHLAAFLTALWRVTEHDDVVVGVPFSRRQKAVGHQGIGCLIDMKPLRVRGVRGRLDDTLAATLTEVDANAEATRSADLSIAEISAHLARTRSVRGGLYQVVFAYQTDDRPKLELGSAASGFQRPLPPAPMADLVVELSRSADADLTIRLIWDTSAVSRTFAERLAAAHLAVLTEDGGREP